MQFVYGDRIVICDPAGFRAAGIQPLPPSRFDEALTIVEECNLFVSSNAASYTAFLEMSDGSSEPLL